MSEALETAWESTGHALAGLGRPATAMERIAALEAENRRLKAENGARKSEITLLAKAVDALRRRVQHYEGS